MQDGCIVLHNALDSQLPKKLLNFIDNQTSFKNAGISSTQNKHIDTSKRSDKILWLDEDSDVQSEYLNFCKELQQQLNRELYLGLNYYESHFSIYEEGAFYEKHVDAFKNSKSRVVTTVYYLNEGYKQEDAGELLIYNENNELIQTITPQANTLVVFLSDKFPHEVRPTKKTRYSIAGWFRV